MAELAGKKIGAGEFFAILGPCVIETPELTLEIAHRLSDMASRLGLPVIFKASFDKANRTSIESFRGPGFEAGLKVLARVKQETGLPVISDIHLPDQAEAAAQVLDVIQIPAFLCRQTDLLVAVANTGLPVNVKKGQFLAPHDVGPIVGKLRARGCREIWLTERGSSFGYNNLVVDMRSLPIMKARADAVVMDATHSVQLPGGLGSVSGGDREMVPTLAKAAVAAGADAVFMEVHPDPDRAKCDGPNSLELDKLEPLLKTLMALNRLVQRQG